MLVWNANFQIPSSGTQSAYVYLFAEVEDKKTKLYFYSDEAKKQLIYEEELELSGDVGDVYEYILTLEKYQQYKKV